MDSPPVRSGSSPGVDGEGAKLNDPHTVHTVTHVPRGTRPYAVIEGSQLVHIFRSEGSEPVVTSLPTISFESSRWSEFRAPSNGGRLHSPLCVCERGDSGQNRLTLLPIDRDSPTPAANRLKSGATGVLVPLDQTAHPVLTFYPRNRDTPKKLTAPMAAVVAMRSNGLNAIYAPELEGRNLDAPGIPDRPEQALPAHRLPSGTALED